MTSKKKQLPEDFDISKYLGADTYQRKNDLEDDVINIPHYEDSPFEQKEISPKPLKQKQQGKHTGFTLEDYHTTFLSIPKITDRKTVFISNQLREQIVDIVRKLGEEKSSVSGFVENLVKHHLQQYHQEIKNWKKQ